MVEPDMTKILEELNQYQFWQYWEMCPHIVEDKMYLTEVKIMLGPLSRTHD